MADGKRVLLLGGTGAMGAYLVPELLEKGYRVDVVSLDNLSSPHPHLRYLVGDAMDDDYMRPLLDAHYNGIVDFMIYATPRFQHRYRMLLENTDHYFYLSSYRVYAGEYPLTESSPRMLDTSDNKIYLATDDYSLRKARGEDILRASGFHNWTAVRPTCVYSKRRFQLCTLEANVFVRRAREGKKIILPEEAKPVQATLTWAGDVAKMFSGLLFNEKAYEECFTFGTAEHHTWDTVAGYYHDIIGVDAVWIPRMDAYLSAHPKG